VLLAEIAATSTEVGSLSSRLAKVNRVAVTLAAAHTPVEIGVIVAWLSGELPQRQIGVGWASLRSLPEPAATATLTVESVDATFSAIKALAGPGSQARRAESLAALFGSATAEEQQFLRRLLAGELRQGALAGVMVDAVAKAAAIPVAAVRRAAMLAGDLPVVAAAALSEGEAALARFALQVGRPVGPMLAQTATSVDDALDKLGGTALFESKLDGARVQVHRAGDTVTIYTRSLDDVTARLPEVVAATLALPVTDLIADAEAIALRPGHTASRSPPPGSAPAPSSRPASRCRCSFSTCCTATAPTCWTCR
jgi:DNA ligase-1